MKRCCLQSRQLHNVCGGGTNKSETEINAKKKKRIKSKVWIDFRLVKAELTKKSKPTVSPREQTRDDAIMTVIRARR